jgi:hypothetical protein
VRQGFDVFAAAGGPNKAVDLTYPVLVSNGQISITLTAVLGYPKINAIEITETVAAAFTPIRVNAGGGAYKDSQGIQWSADNGFLQPGASWTTSSVSNTADPGLYQTEHYSTSGTLTYEFAVPNGSYTVVLKFAEIYYTAAGRRVFDVAINGRTLYPRLDIFTAAGGANIAFDLQYPVTVSDGRISINLAAVTAFPKINAIAIR